MSLRDAFHTIVARLRGSLRPGALDADFEQEMAAHLAAAEEDGVRRGLTPEEARRAALVQLGGLTQLREATRAAQGLPWAGACWLDIKLAVRLLFKHPGLTRLKPDTTYNCKRHQEAFLSSDSESAAF